MFRFGFKFVGFVPQIGFVADSVADWRGAALVLKESAADDAAGLAVCAHGSTAHAASAKKKPRLQQITISIKRTPPVDAGDEARSR